MINTLMNYDDGYVGRLGWWWVDQSHDQIDWGTRVDDMSRTCDMD